MCTVSVIPLSGAGGYRLVTNRDEHRERAEALPPRWREVAPSPAGPGVRAIWPTDATAGGTWVGAARSGLTLTVLNLNLGVDRGGADRGGGDRGGADRSARFGPRSRGLVIPELINSRTPEEAAERLSRMDLREFLPFRLIAMGEGPSPDRARIVECRWDGSSVRVVGHDGSPICFVSSGLGDRLVEPRLALFEAMVVGRGATAQAQDEFHAHRWTDRPQISVMMSRTDARTVSVCRVEARRTGAGWDVHMDYQPVPETPVAGVSGPVRVLAQGRPVRRGGDLSA